MIGPRVGPKVGLRVGPAIGVGADAVAPDSSGIPGVTRDAQSLKYAPANATEWTAFMTAAGLATGNPASVWNLQEASGNAADSIGAITLTPTLITTYQGAVTGWARKGLGGADAAAAAMRNTTTAPNPSTTSTMLLCYVSFPTVPAAPRDLLGVASNALVILMNGAENLRLTGGASADGVSTVGANVRPVVMRVNITAGTITLFTDQEKLSATYALPVSGNLMTLGRVTGTISNALYMYCCEFTGSAAEITDAQVKTMLTTLGWTIPWT